METNIAKFSVIFQVGPKFTVEEAMLFEKCLRSTANVVLRKGNKVTELDNLSKDGDAGSTLRRIAERKNHHVSQSP